jgi:dihydrofolate synthase/folylpolyglutamate synthase
MLKRADEIKEHLFSLTTKGIKYDLERISKAAEKCGSPQNSYRIFHIAGTNGKGSTCFFLESILRAGGFKTGLFTSPHIVKFEERFRINGKNVNEKEWADVYQDLHLIIDEFGLTFFEAITLIAFELFRRAEIDYMVCETGLGGRLDATNIIKPVVSVITAISVDHQEYLGNSIIDIAEEKAGIIKENIPVITGNNDNDEVINLIKRVCLEKNTLCRIVCEDQYTVNTSKMFTEFKCDGFDYQIKTPGDFQVRNASFAIEAVKQAGLFDYGTVYNGLKNTFIPARFHQVKINGKTVIFDVGHNCQAAEILKKAIQNSFGSKRICIVTGIMKDKDVAGILQIYSGFADHIILTRPSTPRAEFPEKMVMMIKDKGSTKFSIKDTIPLAVAASFEMANDIVCICGSFYTVGEAFDYLGIET